MFFRHVASAVGGYFLMPTRPMETIAKAQVLLLAAGAASIVTAVAIDKSSPGAMASADFACFTGVSDFIIGYGMDDAGKHRGLPYIAKAI